MMATWGVRHGRAARLDWMRLRELPPAGAPVRGFLTHLV
jgi:hypothetical protein